VPQETAPLKLKFRGAMVLLFGEGTTKSGKYRAYIDGKLVKETTTDPTPLTATDGFWIGGKTFPTGLGYVFNGSIDEVRYQTFNPLAAGAFDPTSFLISVPEPGFIAVFLSMIPMLRARRRDSSLPARAPR